MRKPGWNSSVTAAPPATAFLLVRRVWLVMLVAVGIGWLAVLGGLLISYHGDTAAGATMSGLAVAIFFTALAVREVVTRFGGARPAVEPHPAHTH